MVFAITAVLVLLVVGAALAVVLTRNDAAGASEIFLSPQNEPGPDPFTASAASASPPEATVPSTNTTVASGGGAPSGGSSGGIQSLPAAQPGLYGGTQNVSYCDPDRMVTFLEANPDKAAAWSSVLGISTSQIRTYVSKLTPVLLRSDTRVTNHGFANGRATTINAVLQAGTAVLVDEYGVPRVKCNCGNPLTPPTPISAPRYTGPSWPGYSVTNIVVVQQSTTIINNFTLYNPQTRTDFVRPSGTAGTDDKPAGGTSTTNRTTSTTESSTTTEPLTTTTRRTTTAPSIPPVQSPTTPPPTTAPSITPNDVVSVFVARRAVCLSNPNLNWPFKASSTADQYSAAPTGNPDVFTFTAVNHPPGETQTWTWNFHVSTGYLEPTNGLAQQANAGCSTLAYGG
ncbi:MAG: hypothetical protein HYX32_13865 [Actinobacteria bacterium]|nr:hypothetical protein [Actinomycetota bacterium]